MADVRKPKLAMLLTEDWFFCSHFMDRAVAARDAGYDVTVLANSNGKDESIRAMGMDFVPIPLSRRGLNPLSELSTFSHVLQTYRKLLPDVVHHVGLKPIIYGTLASRLAGGAGIVNAPVGMGFVYTSNTIRSVLLRPLVWLALRFLMNPPSSKVIFENGDDLGDFVREGTVRAADAVLIRGAGVDLEKYDIHAEPKGVPVVTMVSRMLWDKGVGEFVEAARMLRGQRAASRFWLVGAPDSQNPAAIPESQLLEWHEEGVVEWLGHRDDIPGILAESHIACLPSYREGLPKSLLEAMAAGLPVVAADVPGCREAVSHGENGLLVPARNAFALAEALKRLIDDPALRHALGSSGRHRAETEFASEIVVAQTLKVYREVRP